MNNKKLVVLILGAIIILALIILAVFLGSKNSTLSNPITKVFNSNTNPIAPTDNLGNPVSTPIAGEQAAPVVEVIVNPLAVMPGSPEAPKQEVIEVSKVSDKAIKLSVSDEGFSPKEFTVKAGEKVQLAITASGANAHVFLFPNASLMALTMMVSNNETKIIDFVAPAAGSYSFRDDIPNYRANTGTMIVK